MARSLFRLFRLFRTPKVIERLTIRRMTSAKVKSEMSSRSTCRFSNEIDFQSIRYTVSLKSEISRRRPPAVNGKYLCPFHDDHNPSLTIIPNGKGWKCWACDAKGDVLDFVARCEFPWDYAGDRKGARVKAACLFLGEPSKRPRKPIPPPPPKSEPSPVWHNPEWQRLVNEVIIQAESYLWSIEGRNALKWLKSRCFNEDTCRRFRLGFVPEEYRTRRVLDRAIYVKRGIMIPWIAPHSNYAEPTPRWVGCNVRQLHQDVLQPWTKEDSERLGGKYVCFGKRGYQYPFADLSPSQGHRPCIVTEGEFDALLVNQELGHLVHVATVGGATQGFDPTVDQFVERCPALLIATDQDDAGEKAARNWLDRYPSKAVRLSLPIGKDFNDFLLAGGDATAWLRRFARRNSTI